jgi:hypothetical protein
MAAAAAQDAQDAVVAYGADPASTQFGSGNHATRVGPAGAVDAGLLRIMQETNCSRKELILAVHRLPDDHESAAPHAGMLFQFSLNKGSHEFRGNRSRSEF